MGWLPSSSWSFDMAIRLNTRKEQQKWLDSRRMTVNYTNTYNLGKTWWFFISLDWSTRLVFSCGPFLRQKPIWASSTLNAIARSSRNYRSSKGTALILSHSGSCHIKWQWCSLDNILHLILLFKKADHQGLAWYLSWLEQRPDTPGMRVGSPVRAHTGLNQWMHK